MATPSQVKAGLDDIATVIRTERKAVILAIARITAAEARLNNLATEYADVIATIDGFIPTGAAETLAKDDKARLQAEFVELRTKTTTAKTGLAAIDFTN